jgi:Fur family transcriptional regulator, ferric uptake regulator
MRASSVDQVILDLLARQDDHLTSHEIYSTIRTQLPAVNPSTVYRALDRLSAHGQVSVSDMGLGAEVYESVNHGRHHHFVCQSCHSISLIDDQDVETFFQKLNEKYKVEISTNHLVLFGKCEVCKGSE